VEEMKLEGQPLGLRGISHKHLLLCEGMHDVQFFRHFGPARGLPLFDSASCGFVAGHTSGRDGVDHLTGALDALPAIPNFNGLESILIVADNDGDPILAFQKVRRLIEATADIRPGHRYVAPASPQISVGTAPLITVLMLPWTATVGALDTLCLGAARNREPAIAACGDNFATCIDPVGWTATKVDKMKLRAHISAAYSSDPYISPAWVWRDGTDLVPLHDVVFDQIETFLRAFLT
jgi:hypothetical protein